MSQPDVADDGQLNPELLTTPGLHCTEMAAAVSCCHDSFPMLPQAKGKFTLFPCICRVALQCASSRAGAEKVYPCKGKKPFIEVLDSTSLASLPLPGHLLPTLSQRLLQLSSVMFIQTTELQRNWHWASSGTGLVVGLVDVAFGTFASPSHCCPPVLSQG